MASSDSSESFSDFVKIPKLNSTNPRHVKRWIDTLEYLHLVGGEVTVQQALLSIRGTAITRIKGEVRALKELDMAQFITRIQTLLGVNRSMMEMMQVLLAGNL